MRGFRLSREKAVDKYQRAQERISEGLWSVDADAGQVYSQRGKPIGSVMANGYIFLTMSPSGGRSNQNAYAHRVIWESVHGPIPEGLQVNHINGIKTDNRIANLELVTPSGNMLHAHRTGLAHGAPKGEAHHAAKITSIDVARIRARAADGDRQCDIAAEVGLSRQRINAIVRNKSWVA